MEGQQYIQRHNYSWEREGLNISLVQSAERLWKLRIKSDLRTYILKKNNIAYQKEPELFEKIADFKVGIVKT